MEVGDVRLSDVSGFCSLSLWFFAISVHDFPRSFFFLSYEFFARSEYIVFFSYDIHNS